MSVIMLAVLATQACSESRDTAAAPTREADFTPAATIGGPVPICAERQLGEIAIRPDEVAKHRRFELPVIRYSHGAAPEAWGMDIALSIDETGNVACYRALQDGVQSSSERLAILKDIGGWRYTPFIRGGHPVAALVYEHVPEEESPQAHRPLPDVPLEQVRIALERTSGGWYSNPAYRVEIRGDGTALYLGKSGVVVEGEHRYRVPAREVARLVESLRSKDIWSFEPSYNSNSADSPIYRLTVVLGARQRTVEDNAGQSIGMPRAVSEFQDEVDRVARTVMWKDFTLGAVEMLKAERFVFASPAGAELLARAMARSSDEDAILALIELGAPLEVPDSPKARHQGWTRPLLEVALARRHVRVAKVLIDHGALASEGRRDQKKIDAAFRTAVAGGRLELVELIWETAGPAHRPKLVFDDTTAGPYVPKERAVSKQSPLTLTLQRRNADAEWEGAAIAEWLAARGCDLNARSALGETLLHTAASTNDGPLVRYLLAQGVDALAQDQYGHLALTRTGDEDVALQLLEAGADQFGTRNAASRHRFTAARERLRLIAVHEHWRRVLAWMEANP